MMIVIVTKNSHVSVLLDSRFMFDVRFVARSLYDFATTRTHQIQQPGVNPEVESSQNRYKAGPTHP